MVNYVHNFKIKPVTKKKVNIKNKVKELNKLITGECFVENNTFKIKVNISTTTPSDVMLLPFTSESYDTKDRQRLYVKDKALKGEKFCILVDELKAKNSPLPKEYYTPLCPGEIYNGYIVKINGVLCFDMKEHIGNHATIMHQDNDFDLDD